VDWDLKQIKELMAAMEKTQTQRLRVKEGTYELLLERQDGRIQHSEDYYKPEMRDDRFFQRQDSQLFKTESNKPAEGGVSVKEEKAKKGNVIKSPMVGTVYMAPSPDDAPFVKFGDSVEADTVICIIEAMKVMNEIKAGVKGRIAEVLVDNGQPVEFGTALFSIES